MTPDVVVALPHTSTPKHIVTVSGLVTHPSADQILLIRSPRRGWEFPGGQVEEGESLTDALVREVHEETGLAISVGPLVGIYSNTRSKIVMFGFLCSWTGDGTPTTSEESLQVEWVKRDEALARVTSPPIQDRMRDMLEFTGSVVYRAYEYSARDEDTTAYLVREERCI